MCVPAKRGVCACVYITDLLREVCACVYLLREVCACVYITDLLREVCACVFITDLLREVCITYLMWYVEDALCFRGKPYTRQVCGNFYYWFGNVSKSKEEKYLSWLQGSARQ